MIANHPYMETLVTHLVATLILFSQIYSYYIRGDRSPLTILQLELSAGVINRPIGILPQSIGYLSRNCWLSA